LCSYVTCDEAEKVLKVDMVGGGPGVAAGVDTSWV